MRDRNEGSKRRIDYVIQWLQVGNGIGDELIPDTEVDRQPGSRLPLILSVSVDLNFAEVASGVRIGGDGSNKEERVPFEKIRDAGKGVGAAPPSVLREVALHPAE